MPVVKLFANLRKLAGTKELSVAGSTVRVVVNGLIDQNPLVGEIVLEGENLRPHIVITLNGHNVTDMDVPVNERDVIAIFPPIAGG
jgi:MoaD family protein